MFLILFLLLSIVILFISKNYKYNKCVKTNKEELRKCQKGNYGNYDCSTFENAEEQCSVLLEVNN